MILRRKSIVTIDIFYYRQDYRNLLQEFVWQTEDLVPEYPRIHKFLNHWRENIKATIAEIQLCHAEDSKWVNANFLKGI